MSLLDEHLQTTSAFHYPESLDAFQRNIPFEWIEQALTETGRAAVRKRRFPAQQAVWLVPGSGLVRNRSISDVCDKLDLAFPDNKGEFPLEERVDVYWERWEIERGYSEVKQSQLGNTTVLRSQKRNGVYQEIWGILISYNLVRLKMRRMAESYQVHPLRISFLDALRLIQEEFLWCSGRTPGTIPKKLQNLRESACSCRRNVKDPLMHVRFYFDG